MVQEISAMTNIFATLTLSNLAFEKVRLVGGEEGTPGLWYDILPQSGLYQFVMPNDALIYRQTF